VEFCCKASANLAAPKSPTLFPEKEIEQAAKPLLPTTTPSINQSTYIAPHCPLPLSNLLSCRDSLMLLEHNTTFWLHHSMAQGSLLCSEGEEVSLMMFFVGY